MKKKSIAKTFSREDNTDYFQKAYKRYFDRLFGYALVITNCESLAKDVVSEVFFNLWNTRRDLHAIKELKAYLFTSVKNQALRSLSKDPAHFQTDQYEHTTHAIDQINPEDLLVGKELEQLINNIIDKLPPQCGLVFQLVKENNMTPDEVAKELGITKDTVKYHLKTALAKIRSDLETHFADPPVHKWISIGCNVLLVTHLLLKFIQ